MENITNDEMTKEVSRVLGHQIENKPLMDTSKVILVAEVNPKMLKYANVVVRANSSSTGTTTVYTTPTDREFYLTSICISFSATVANDQVLLYLSGVFGGVAIRLIDINLNTLTVQNQLYNKEYHTPVRLDKGTAILLVKAFTAGAGVYSCTICGYTQEYVSAL